MERRNERMDERTMMTFPLFLSSFEQYVYRPKYADRTHNYPTTKTQLKQKIGDTFDTLHTIHDHSKVGF